MKTYHISRQVLPGVDGEGLVVVDDQARESSRRAHGRDVRSAGVVHISAPNHHHAPAHLLIMHYLLAFSVDVPIIAR